MLFALLIIIIIYILVKLDIVEAFNILYNLLIVLKLINILLSTILLQLKEP